MFTALARSAASRSSWAMARPVQRTTLAMLSATSLSTAVGTEAGPSLHSLSGKRMDATTVSMSDFIGKPVLVVNVASR